MNVAPIWRAYEAGELDMFQVAAILAGKLAWKPAYVAHRYTLFQARCAARKGA